MKMKIAPLTLEYRDAWADLLAIAFASSHSNMAQLLDRLHAESTLTSDDAKGVQGLPCLLIMLKESKACLVFSSC